MSFSIMNTMCIISAFFLKKKWTRKAAEWNPGLIISTRTQRRAGRPAKRWEDDLNEFVTDEETQTTRSDALKVNKT